MRSRAASPLLRFGKRNHRAMRWGNAEDTERNAQRSHAWPVIGPQLKHDNEKQAACTWTWVTLSYFAEDWQFPGHIATICSCPQSRFWLRIYAPSVHWQVLLKVKSLHGMQLDSIVWVRCLLLPMFSGSTNTIVMEGPSSLHLNQQMQRLCWGYAEPIFSWGYAARWSWPKRFRWRDGQWTWIFDTSNWDMLAEKLHVFGWRCILVCWCIFFALWFSFPWYLEGAFAYV